MVNGSHRRVRLEISVGTLKRNYLRIADAVNPCRVVAVLKANAYGLGVQGVAGALAEAGAPRFAVAELNEALALRSFGRPVQILGGVLADEIPEAVAAGIVLPVTDPETARLISAEAVRQERAAVCQFLVDTGMGRLGILAADAENVVADAVRLPGLQCEGIYTHFPMAYRSGSEFTQRQIEIFLDLLARLERRGIAFALRHMANSDAVNNFPRTYRPPFNAVRTGINLHGSFDMEGRRALDLRPVLTLKTRLTAVRRLPAGSTVGYGCTVRLPAETLVGTISAGYADGLPLAVSNRGHVLIRGRPCRILGRVSMDYTTVDLSGAPDARPGDEVVCLGGEGPDAVSVEDWARIKGTHPYEIICSFGSRVERCYVE
ncbi:MAG: alanine racemase [Lentisphaerae bacterium]|nr:alanine racemase [Lentisphaerota bacterium]